MKNSFRIIFFFFCIFFIGCKKNDSPSDTTPKISFIFNGTHVQYSGKATGIQFEGVAFATIKITIDSSEYQYTVLAGKDDKNYIFIVFNGPYPLQKSNITQIKYVGITYASNGATYGLNSFDSVHITIDNNNFLTGTFSGPAISSQTGQSFTLSGGTFENVVLH